MRGKTSKWSNESNPSSEPPKFTSEGAKFVNTKSRRAIQHLQNCCETGSYECQIPMPINRRLEYIDYCIADIVAALNAAGITTLASCCGHGKQDGNIELQDGRALYIDLQYILRRKKGIT